MVIWIIGMSASGKTTLGKKLYDKITLSENNWVFLDGDAFRLIMGEDLGHTPEDRNRNAYRISKFCEFLDSQGINVLACVLSLFHDNQKYNRENISNYKEIYLEVDFDTLVKRDNKDLYRKALKGEIENVVGVDIDFKPPYSPDLVIDNNSENSDYSVLVSNIIEKLGISLEERYRYTSRNLLKKPHKYTYSKFEGKEFFQLYNKDRKECKDFFSQRLARIGKARDATMARQSGEARDANNLVLRDFLITLYGGSDGELDEQKIVVETLIKRFEVGKKLFLTYDLTEIRKSTKEHRDLLNYPLFSLILQRYYRKTSSQQKLVYLNAILKVNDIISSIRSEFILPDEINHAIKSIEGELVLLGEYM